MEIPMDKFVVALPKRKMNDDITENFDVNGDIKKSKGNHIRSELFEITEVQGDLFTCSESTSLAHCISQDVRMGKGIATLFKCPGNSPVDVNITAVDQSNEKTIGTVDKAICFDQISLPAGPQLLLLKSKFGGVQELLDQGRKSGDVAVLKRSQRFVYYLVTKERYWHKPTYMSLRSSLQAMKRHALQHSVAAIAMPRIGCGLDGLVWDRVREILTDVFKDTDIKLSVYYI